MRRTFTMRMATRCLRWLHWMQARGKEPTHLDAYKAGYRAAQSDAAAKSTHSGNDGEANGG